MKRIVLLTVGTTKDKNIISLEKEFLKRFTLFELKLVHVKAHGENRSLEAKEIFDYIDSNSKKEKFFPILMAEYGKKYDSPQFAQMIGKKLEGSATALLIIGGNAGHDEKILEKCWPKISLSAMTFPHQFAKLLTIEQLYRSQAILTNHPYHK